jgi:DNA modification methylase
LLVDKIVTSPPYSEGLGHQHRKYGRDIEASKSIQPPEYSRSPNNIGNLPYGAIDKIVTSPPYAEALDRDEHKHPGGRVADMLTRSYLKSSHGKSGGQIGNLPYGEIDKIITSPPYEAAVTGKDGIDWSKGTMGKAEGNKPRDRSKEPAFNHLSIGGAGFAYSGSKDNIGNLKSQSYLEAMLQVYQQCYKVLKPQGLMILVTKNFIRNKQIVRLDLDTINLCEQSGFSFIKRHYRKLPSQSFWRIIYYQKHPDVPVIDKEDILVFRK